MGRTVAKTKTASVHSRAARRLTSPGIDLDKSIKNIQPPTFIKKSRPSLLEIHQSAGVSKKSKSRRKTVLSAKAKRRYEKGLDHAVAVMQRTEKKVKKSKSKARIVHERSLDWDNLNRQMDTQKIIRSNLSTLETSSNIESNKSINLRQGMESIKEDDGRVESIEDSISEKISSLLILPKSEKGLDRVDIDGEIL
ncbi:hypothetical protein HI914_06677 [Erysiphe necator]|uniref:Ribosome biogenesis protein Alb1 n=1 Tax=Uncinula necator TaxID=52586 RepID=A0A0B1NZ45_UNCNE|nr:hypothetical protein HI914_06677 [Erysiphe necator]KHJ31677.1 hypothetical protein EV44_g5074 [Erysiphe necator]